MSQNRLKNLVAASVVLAVGLLIMGASFVYAEDACTELFPTQTNLKLFFESTSPLPKISISVEELGSNLCRLDEENGRYRIHLDLWVPTSEVATVRRNSPQPSKQSGGTVSRSRQADISVPPSAASSPTAETIIALIPSGNIRISCTKLFPVTKKVEIFSKPTDTVPKLSLAFEELTGNFCSLDKAGGRYRVHLDLWVPTSQLATTGMSQPLQPLPRTPMPAAAPVAQGPAVPITPFDGKYIGTAIRTAGPGESCAPIGSIDMTIAGERVIVREIHPDGTKPTLQGIVREVSAEKLAEVSAEVSAKASAEVSALSLHDGVSGKIRDKVFTGQLLVGSCNYSVHMVKE